MKSCGIRVASLALAALLAMGRPSVISAQTAPLSFEPTSRTPPVVEDRPTATEWVAGVRGGGLVEGRIELKLTALAANMPEQNLGMVLTDELVFSGENQPVRVMLPAFHWSYGAEEILVRPRLHTKHGAVDLPEQRLRAPLRTARKFPLLLSETKTNPRTKSGEIGARDKLGDRLRFESLLPEELSERALTVINHVDITEFPQDPLAFCQHELVAVTGDDFSSLRPAQLDALRIWVRAGGRLCLEPGGVLTAAHVDFLNRLADGDDRQLVFALDDKGRLAGSVTAGSDSLRLTCGLGRVLLGFWMEQSLLRENARPTIAWLWHIRDDRIASLMAGETPTELQSVGIQNSPQGYYFGLPAPLTQDVTAQLLDWLRPAGVRMVPLWIIGSLLSALVLWIGPVDYFGLSLIHRRKWTWITFPIAVFAATLLMVLVTNAYLSVAETRRTLIVHDVAGNGDILRTNRLELIFTSSTRSAASDVKSALFAPLLTGGVSDPRMRGYRQQVVSVKGPDGQVYQRVITVPDSGAGPTEPVAVAGRIPSRYQIIQEIRQWTPQLNRSFSLGPADDASAVDWAGISLPSPSQAPAAGRYDQLLAQVREQLGPEAQVAVLGPANEVWSSDPQTPTQQLPYGPYAGAQYRDPAWEKIHTFPVSPRMNSLLRLTSAPSYGLFALVNQTAPNGGSSLDDLPLTVTGSNDGWWLVIFIPKGDDFVVYRKPYPFAR